VADNARTDEDYNEGLLTHEERCIRMWTAERCGGPAVIAAEVTALLAAALTRDGEHAMAEAQANELLEVAPGRLTFAVVGRLTRTALHARSDGPARLAALAVTHAGGDRIGCSWRSGTLAEGLNGRGVDKDAARAVPLFRKACDAGAEPGFRAGVNGSGLGRR